MAQFSKRHSEVLEVPAEMESMFANLMPVQRCLFIDLPIDLSIYLPIYLSLCLFTHKLTYLSIYWLLRGSWVQERL